jgi:hypothetical protein
MLGYHTRTTGIFTLLLLQGLFMANFAFAQQSTTVANEVRSFKAQYLPDRGMELTWSTKFNDTTAYTSIERSIDGLHFEKIGEVLINNTKTNYRFIDRSPVKDVSYYRLEVTDYDGNSFHSALISTYIPTYGKPELVLYPMPVGNAQTLNLNFQGVEKNFKAQVTITDQTGRQVLNQEMNINALQTQSELNLNGLLPPGNYQITVLAHSGQSFKIGKLLQIIN